MKPAHVVSFAIGSLFALGAGALVIESCTTGESVNGNPGTAGTSGAAGTTGTTGTAGTTGTSTGTAGTTGTSTGTAGTTGTSTGTAGTTGTSTGTAGTTGTSTGTAGTTGTSAGTAGTTGTSTGTAGTTGTSTGTAGTTGAAGTTASAGSTGSAGTTASGGATGSAGATGAGGGAWPPTPNCTGLTTAAGGAPGKGGTCTASDPQLCYKTCGPSSIGYKSEMCMSGMYAEMSGCSFDPSADYSCYKIPTTQSASCPTSAPPQASQSCSGVPMCTVCSMNGMYLDSGGSPKTGYCVCPSGASPKWTCAANNAWPCPSGNGC